jgi:uncharacterized protein
LCAGYKQFFNHIDRPMRMMARLLQQGRAPAEVMNWLAMEELQKLQNAMKNARPEEPCPCGSGLLFQKCHGKKNPRKEK